MNKTHKHPLCFNCNRPLSSTDNFCPGCGQENKNPRLGMKAFIEDFFSNYLSFDSRLGRSISPFLFKPGKLTICYNEGKRMQYVNPVRHYLVISFLFFFLLALFIDKMVEESDISLADNDQGVLIVDTEPDMSAEEAQLKADSALEKDSAARDSSPHQSLAKKASAPPAADKGSNRFLSLMKKKELTDAQIVDSLNMNKENAYSEMIIHQSRKVVQKDIDVFIPYLLQNLPLMMFILLPVFSFYLWLLFRKREGYYISHLIHALHLHAFGFLILTAGIICMFFFEAEYIGKIAFILISLYAFFSIKRVYGQGWGKTFLKFNILGFFYIFTLSTAFMLELGISFMLF